MVGPGGRPGHLREFDGLNGDRPVDDQFWTLDSEGVTGHAAQDDLFGWSLATGDFDGDGYADLAIGVPLEDVARADGTGSHVDAGAVHVLYGSSTGLTAVGDDLITQKGSAVLDEPEDDDQFGFALVAGDFGGDERDDLAIGVPHEDIGNVSNAGAVNVLFGSASGLTTVGDELWHQGVSGVLDTLEANDRFGWALAAGDLGQTDQEDLIVGIPFENIGSIVDAGAVQVLYGTDDGLTAVENQFWNQSTPDVAGAAEASDHFGYAVAAGDLGRTSHADLTVGIPREDLDGTDEGAVAVLYGFETGLISDDDQLWYQDSPGIRGESEGGDVFGWSLAIADFGNGGRADLAIGVPGEDKENAVYDDHGTGAVNVLYGRSAGLTASGDQFWWQDSTDIEGETENGDQFGFALAAADYGFGTYADLAVGVPGETASDSFNVPPVGAVNVIYGTAEGLHQESDDFWWQASSTLHDSAENHDDFGHSLAN